MTSPFCVGMNERVRACLDLGSRPLVKKANMSEVPKNPQRVLHLASSEARFRGGG